MSCNIVNKYFEVFLPFSGYLEARPKTKANLYVGCYVKYLHWALTITNKKMFLEKDRFLDGVPDYERIWPDVD